MMKYTILALFFCSALSVRAQTKVNNFHIVDAETKLAIPYVSVSLSRANLAMNTEKDGLLTIPGDLATFRDTIFISSQNYLTIRTPVRNLNGLDTIRLRRSLYQPLMIRPSITGIDSVLNKFDWTEVSYFAGLHTESSRFNYLQLAQEFDTPIAGATLTKISICRLAHTLSRMSASGADTPDPFDYSSIELKQEEYVDLEFTRFRLRFYDVSPGLQGPGRDICTSIVEVYNKEDQYINIDLKKYNIVIPGKKFFIAIEWLRTFDNAGYAGYRSEQNLIYKPTLGILPYQTNKLHIWGMNYSHQWKPYTYYSPDWTDLAISPTLKW